MALALLLAGCATTPTRDPGSDAMPPAPPVMVILAADAHGAVVLDGVAKVYRGVSRSGAVIWVDADAARAAPLVTCLAACPDVALSADIASLNSPTAPDPVPRLVVAGQARPLSELDGTTRRVVSARGVDDLVVVQARPEGGWWLRTRVRGVAGPGVVVGGRNTAWQETPDGRHALVITSTGPGTGEARWFDRPADIWRVAGPAITVAGFTGCVAPDGQRAVLLGQRPALLTRDGTQRPITDLEAGGLCGLSPSGTIVAELARALAPNGGGRSRIRALDAAGATVWRADIDAAADVSADPTADRVCYVAQGRLHEFDLRTRAQTRVLDEAAAARYVEDGSLVVLSPNGTVRWV